MIRYVAAAEIYSINEEVVGYRPYVRDRHLLRSAAERPAMEIFGQEQFPTLHDKAAALMHSLAYHHLFADGNKRTATITVTRFLEANGYDPTWTETEIRGFVLEVAQDNHTLAAIADWLRDHTQPQSNNHQH